MPARFRILIVVLWVVVVLAAGAMIVTAAESTTAARATAPATTTPKEQVQTQTLFQLIDAGGLIGYVIMFLLVIAIALAIEHAMTIRRGVIMPPEVLAEIEECFEKEEYEQAITVCEERPTFFTNVIAAGLSRINAGYKQMEEAMAEAGEEAATNLQHKISYIALITNIAPMLGLLGTVQGMIMAFQQIGFTAAPKPSELAIAIELALVTTFQGLTVAIPIMCIYHFFKNRVQKLVLEVGAVSGELMARFRPAE